MTDCIRCKTRPPLVEFELEYCQQCFDEMPVCESCEAREATVNEDVRPRCDQCSAKEAEDYEKFIREQEQA